ncbi:conserved hypothetical protein [Azorhizobium caulinodans ORS 571]|uniref:Transmembrane protein n=1 Tax=Azorhizobium caulinodans (strain ATCC 43989 / DSM 5975 / JCM 20966 / LMG 6465 / NBRC 14845 / NCIMB 13405 / ORS 571) TaxID=438753 RepID=A8I3V5_AZOC5|nr:hypothetical protein [Azorhizobium caulinodans]BAF87656.1 conserved hypothetical protein [Azorhizobium caulinodans ORS 571]
MSLSDADALVHGGDDGAGRHSYAFRPRMIGAATRVVLDTRGAEGLLEWTVGATSGRTPLRDITRLRLRHELGQLGSSNFALLIEGRGLPRLRIGSVSRTGLTAVKDHGPAFIAFLNALHAALLRDSGRVRYEAGLPRWRWGGMLALSACCAAAICWLAALAFSEGQGTSALLIVGLSLVLAFPLAETLWRNRPGPYEPDALPQRLLPSVKPGKD